MLRNLITAIALICALAATPALADTHDSLFVNLTTDEPHRADMAMAFAKSMMERNHPVTIWLNDKGVFLASKEQSGPFGNQQKTLSALMGMGATVIVCPMCMAHYGVKEADLISGAKVGNPDHTSALLFREGTKTLTW
jgi:sulfur relay (sulfurtransferase) complex TusBCD TusD component (DsrE family)